MGVARWIIYNRLSRLRYRASELSDPLADVVGLLHPIASISKLIVGGGSWRVRRHEVGQPYYCVVLEGACRLDMPGEASITLSVGDFVLIPAAREFEHSSLAEADAVSEQDPVLMAPGVMRLGSAENAPDFRALIGYCTFASDDARLLLQLLPRLIHVRGEGRLTVLVSLVDEEARRTRPARDAVLSRLIEVMLIEALRAARGPDASPGLLRGLGDERLAAALRLIHAQPDKNWSASVLARAAGLSRSVFFERFRQEIGAAPMDYLLHWRMALAKDFLRRGDLGMTEIAGQVGYGSASAFSTAFSRIVGVAPRDYKPGRSQSGNSI